MTVMPLTRNGSTGIARMTLPRTGAALTGKPATARRGGKRSVGTGTRKTRISPPKMRGATRDRAGGMTAADEAKETKTTDGVTTTGPSVEVAVADIPTTGDATIVQTDPTEERIIAQVWPLTKFFSASIL